jgi:hypothetical protein
VVHFVDTLSDHGGTALQFIPGNILFSMPQAGDTAMLVRGGETGGPGAAYLFWGDGGDGNRWPVWYHYADGIWTLRPLMLQSKDAIALQSQEQDTTVDCGPGKSVKLGSDAARGVAREADTVGASEAFAAWLNTVAMALSSAGVTPFEGAIGAITSASTKVKAE